MNLEEIQREAVTLKEEERIRLTFFLQPIRRVDSGENKAELSRLHREIDEGRYVTWEELREVRHPSGAKGR